MTQRAVITPSRSGRALAAGRRGFTLPEILIVIVMISVLALLALPRFADANARRHMESARLRVMAGLATARQAAVQKGVPVTFRLLNNRVTVRVSGTTTDLMSPVPLDTLYKVTAALPVSMMSGAITFNGRGYASLTAQTTKISMSRSGVPNDSVIVTKTGMVQR